MSGFDDQMPDSELWRSVCQGSVPAFEVVVQRYQSLVCAVAYSACGNLALSEDVAQEAFWSAWRKRASIAEPERLGAWLCGIARNLGYNARRRLSGGSDNRTTRVGGERAGPLSGASRGRCVA
jgi:zinc protease